MSGGGGQSTATPYEVDQNDLADFMRSEHGQQFASTYNPKNAYAKIGDSIQAYDPEKVGPANLGMFGKVGDDVSAMISAFSQWQTGNQQTKTNWQNYATAVGANAGGQGDSTITAGAEMSQRNQLLGALANAGNTTTPTPGLGVMGSNPTGAKKK